MKTKHYIFLTFILAGLATFSIQAQGTTNYDQDGNYNGEPVSSYYVDFSKFATDALPYPIVSESIQELANTGIKRWCIQERQEMTGPGVTTGGAKSNTLFANNPTIDGNNNKVNPAYIYFPTLKEGAGKIRISGWVGNKTGSPINIYLEYLNGNYEWEQIKAIPIPADGTNGVETGVNKEGYVNLRLRYNNTPWMSFKAIAISAHGQDIESVISSTPQTRSDEPVISNGFLSVGSEIAEVFFYNFNGIQVMHKSNVSGKILLPSTPGIVKVVKNTGTHTLKKL